MPHSGPVNQIFGYFIAAASNYILNKQSNTMVLQVEIIRYVSFFSYSVITQNYQQIVPYRLMFICSWLITHDIMLSAYRIYSPPNVYMIIADYGDNATLEYLGDMRIWGHQEPRWPHPLHTFPPYFINPSGATELGTFWIN